MTVAIAHPELAERQRRITLDEYHRMAEAGILGEDEHVELIDGMLVAMTPQGRAHARVIQRLTRLLVRALGDDLEVLPQLPLTLPDDSEPEPDLAVVRAEDAQSGEHHPRTALLVVEVAGDSLRLDRGSKAALYARAGIRSTGSSTWLSRPWRCTASRRWRQAPIARGRWSRPGRTSLP